MAKQVRKPPSTADNRDPRAREYFDADLYDQHRMSVTTTQTLGGVAPGARVALVFPVQGAVKDVGQVVAYGLPSIWNQDMRVIAAYVSNTDQVTLVVENRSGGTITTPSAVYGIKVMP